MTTTPYTYQLKAVRQIHRFKGRALVAADMGLGKSLISLLYIVRYNIQSAIIIVPASLKYQWQHQASMHVGIRAEILSGTKPPKGKLKTSRRITIINYDILGPWMRYLKALKPDLIIFDECQYLGNLGAVRTRAAQRLCKRVSKVIGLSGTPLVNRPAELFPTLNLLRPKLFPNFYSYAHRHCAPHRAPWGWQFKGATRLPELHKKLTSKLMIRIKKEDVLDQLPAKIRTVVPLDLSSRKEYNHALNDFLDWLWQQSPHLVYKATGKAERLVKMGYMKRLAAKLKMRAALGWIDDFLMTTSEDKLILFAVHKKIIKKVHGRFKDCSVVVDGSVTGQDRDLVIKKFLRQKKTRLFIGNIKAAGVGWSAEGVNNVAFLEIPWAPGHVTQAEDRAHGLGRGKKGEPTNVFFLVARNSIESKLLQILQEKQKVVSSTLDGKQLKNDLNVFDLLTEALLQGVRK